MRESIKNFAEQFGFEPVIRNKEYLVCGLPAQAGERFALCGMGGSHLAAGLLKVREPSLPLVIHRDYGLPEIPKSDLPKTLFIASSYSGNTEEVLDFAKKANQKKLHLAILSVGGMLIEFATENKIPFVKLPDTHIQPRLALGHSIIALAKIIGDEKILTELARLKNKLKPESLEREGKELANKLKGKVPIIYFSAANSHLSYNWKIKFNETGKIPAFANVFPELNHNEMTGFDIIDSTRPLSNNYHFVFVYDSNDHPQIQKRMKVCAKLYKDRKLPVTELFLGGNTPFEKIFNSLLLADWTALHLSKIYGTEPEKVPMVEEFKRLIA